MIRAEGLTRTFGSFRALDGVSFRVREGEVFGLVGPNGAGKTTLLKILATLLPPTSGRAEVAGWEVGRHPRLVRLQVGVVFQEPSLDLRLTVRENLAFHGMLYGLRGERLRLRVAEALELVGFGESARSPVRSLSGGMRRRLELGRTFLHRPPVLLLDEPTVGLDPPTRRAIWDHIRWLREKEGVTVFFTTHYMEEAEKADRLAMMDRGRFLLVDSPAQMRSSFGGASLEEVFMQVAGRTLGQEPAEDPRLFVRMRGG
jgi:ABC-2 type transport system ATP-binding protein